MNIRVRHCPSCQGRGTIDKNFQAKFEKKEIDGKEWFHIERTGKEPEYIDCSTCAGSGHVLVSDDGRLMHIEEPPK